MADEMSPKTFARLQRYAVPLVDSIDTVINKILDFYEASHGAGADSASGTEQGPPGEIPARSFNPATPPDLTHTKVLSAKLNGITLAKSANWNRLLKEAIRKAKPNAKTADDWRRLIVVNFVPGRKEDEGYEYMPELDLSVQGQDANTAWRGAFHIAQQIRCPIEVVFLWRHKEKAAHPGDTGRLVFG